MALAWVGAAAGVVIAPILPTMAHVFIGEYGVDVKIALVATGPSLLVGLSSLPYGFLLDRIGRRKLLIWALLLYGAAGMAPIFITSLNWIILSRFAVGLAEGAVFTASTALLGDYFAGAERERWMAAQTGAAPLAAVGLVFLGGLLGGIGWHFPFLIYGFAWLLVPPALMLLFEPANRSSPSATGDAELASDFSWKKPIWIALAQVLSMIGFMLPIVQFGFLATERGVSAPATIGMWSALATLGNPAGSLLFVFLPFRAPRKLALAYVLYALGFMLMGGIHTIQAAIIGSLIANLGAGILFPTMITWMLSSLPPALRGRGTGLFVTSTFLGQFSGPVAILGLDRLTGSLSRAVFTAGAVSAVIALVASISVLGGRRPLAGTDKSTGARNRA